MLKFTRRLLKHTNSNVNIHNVASYGLSAVTTVELKNTAVVNDDVKPAENKTENGPLRSRNSMVAEVFASLQNETLEDTNTPFTDMKIMSAKSVDDLLSISKGSGVSRTHALKVVSILADWSQKGKVQLPEFDSDPRFIRLCRVLTKGTFTHRSRHPIVRNDDLTTIFAVTADDEAAKLVANLTMPQMVKVMSSLAQKKRRSMMLLRALSYNITKSCECLDLKLCGDLLYSMSVLNFIDENLLERISRDVCKGINESILKSSVVGSILTSFGLLKYKDRDVLDVLSQWLVKHHDISRPQDLFALFLTLATLNHEPPNIEDLCQVLIPQLTIADATKRTEWLDFVWALVALNRASSTHISSVLSQEFVEGLADFATLPSKLKLINIDSVAEILLPTYSGPRLDKSSPIRDIEILRSKEKVETNACLIECLKSLISDVHIKTMVNTGMGFCIDAECILDKKCNPVPFDKFTGAPEQKRVAVVMYDYHDMCKGSVEPTGINVLAGRLLEAKGYSLLTILYSDFKPQDKLVQRVQYLESKLKSLAQS